jgi:hypothetical protein
MTQLHLSVCNRYELSLVFQNCGKENCISGYHKPFNKINRDQIHISEITFFQCLKIVHTVILTKQYYYTPNTKISIECVCITVKQHFSQNRNPVYTMCSHIWK